MNEKSEKGTGEEALAREVMNGGGRMRACVKIVKKRVWGVMQRKERTLCANDSA